MINFRTGTHNPYTLYAGPGDGEPRNPFEVPIGFICDERAALLAAEAMTASACPACPWGCGSCSLNRATCECYEHQDRIDEDGRPVEGSTPIASPARVGICGDEATNLAGLLNRPHYCVLPAGHDGWHENDAVPPMRWTPTHDSLERPAPDMRSRRQGGRGAAAGEVVSVPPPGRCVFCERIAGGYVKWLDHDVASFEPLHPVTPGHVLVVPRRHVADATESPVVSGLVMDGAARVAATLGDCNIITSVGEAATQTIRHLHLHVVPRHHGDGLALPWTGQHTEMPHA